MNGLGKLWFVTRPTAQSELNDVLFQATPQEFAQQVLGGLKPNEVLGWFDSYTEANQVALQEMYVAQRDQMRRRDAQRKRMEAK